MAENIREEDVMSKTFSTYKRSGKTNCKENGKASKLCGKSSERRARFFIYFLSRLLTIYLAKK